MQVTRIQNINNTFNNINFGSIPKFQKQLDAVSAIEDGTITFEQLNNLGLINLAKLKILKHSKELSDLNACKKSSDNIKNIVFKPEFRIEKDNTGYFYETESPYNYRETMEGFATGEDFRTVTFNQKYELNKNLRILAKKGNYANAVDLVGIYTDWLQSRKKQQIIKELAEITENNPVYTCKHENNHSFGTLEIQTPEKILEENISKPIINTIKAIRDRLPQKQVSKLNDLLFDAGCYTALESK